MSFNRPGTRPVLASRRDSRLREFIRLHPGTYLAVVFAALTSIQGLGYFLLGTGRAGMALSESILVVDNLVALACAWAAFRRARGIPALFWFLFCLVVVVLLTPTAIQAHDTTWNTITLSDTQRGLLYCLYGAPILMMLFLPEAQETGRVKSEVALDLFQVSIVVTLMYSTFFFLPVLRMSAEDASLRSISVSDTQTLLLLIAGFIRLQFARAPAARDLLLRVTVFLAICAVITFTGDWVYVHAASIAAWFDLVWAVPIVAAAYVAFTWTPAPEVELQAEPANFLSFLGANLVLVAMLSGLSLSEGQLKKTYGGILTDVTMAAALIALTLRLALTQFHQHREISYRKKAQVELAESHEKVAGLLDSARHQTAQITAINELGTLLQASGSREEALRVIPERLERLFPGTSGNLSVLNAAGTHAEVVAEWGTRRTPVNAERFPANSISIPLIAHNEAIGVLAFQNLESSNVTELSGSHEQARFRQLASALAEHIALTISNLDLRAALQVQAIRDSLTGLYNRRYMEEALDRELHRARRRERPLSVMMIDIDHFKRYNDSFGHGAGDVALRLVAESLIASVRAEDFACRYGGEEFIVILPECALAQAAIRAEEVRTRLRELYVDRSGELPEVVTASIGVAGFQETTGRMDLLIKFADDALYRAKGEGRDRVVIAQPDLNDPHRSTTFVNPGTSVATAGESSTRS